MNDNGAPVEACAATDDVLPSQVAALAGLLIAAPLTLQFGEPVVGEHPCKLLGRP